MRALLRITKFLMTVADGPRQPWFLIKPASPPCRATAGCTVRCVRDVADGTNSFAVNGDYKGAPFVGIPGDLFAVANLRYIGHIVRIN